MILHLSKRFQVKKLYNKYFSLAINDPCKLQLTERTWLMKQSLLPNFRNYAAETNETSDNISILTYLLPTNNTMPINLTEIL